MNDENYLIGLEPKHAKPLSLVQDYKVATKEYDTAIRDLERQKLNALRKKSEKLDEDNKRLKHSLEAIHRFRTQPKNNDPPIDLGNGKVLVSIDRAHARGMCTQCYMATIRNKLYGKDQNVGGFAHFFKE